MNPRRRPRVHFNSTVGRYGGIGSLMVRARPMKILRAITTTAIFALLAMVISAQFARADQTASTSFGSPASNSFTVKANKHQNVNDKTSSQDASSSGGAVLATETPTPTPSPTPTPENSPQPANTPEPKVRTVAFSIVNPLRAIEQAIHAPQSDQSGLNIIDPLGFLYSSSGLNPRTTKFLYGSAALLALLGTFAIAYGNYRNRK